MWAKGRSAVPTCRHRFESPRGLRYPTCCSEIRYRTKNRSSSNLHSALLVILIKSPVDRLFERTMLRQRDGHIGGRKKAFRYLKRSGVAFGNGILQRPHAIDDGARLTVDQRVERCRQVLLTCVAQMQFVKIFRARGPGDGCKLFCPQIDRCSTIAGFDAVGRQPGHQTGRQQ